METFAFASAVRGYHVYKDVWKPSFGEKLVARREFNNPIDKHAVKVVKDDETVGHLPREFFLHVVGKSALKWSVADDTVSSCAEEWRFRAS